LRRLLARSLSTAFSVIEKAMRRIYVGTAQPATFNDGTGKLTDYATLQEAALAWHALPSAQKIRTTVKVIGGPVYTAREIDRLHYGPKPA
jgi:hypothetical protein